jgi:hypothetical protein
MKPPSVTPPKIAIPKPKNVMARQGSMFNKHNKSANPTVSVPDGGGATNVPSGPAPASQPNIPANPAQDTGMTAAQQQMQNKIANSIWQ